MGSEFHFYLVFHLVAATEALVGLHLELGQVIFYNILNFFKLNVLPAICIYLEMVLHI